MRKFLISCALLCANVALFGQSKVVGTVKTATGEPLPYAIVEAVGTFNRAVTTQDGSFELEMEQGKVVLMVTYIGFENNQVVTNSPVEGLEIVLKPSTILIGSALVSATRANVNTPMAVSEVSKEDLEKQNLGQDMPMLLGQTPSVVTTSDAGAGIGYTGLRMRGIDATQINVTINGISLNDSESQGVFWVNVPNISGSTENVQIQRGVGTSTNGAGAFGGTINLQTSQATQKAFGEVNVSAGSFGTFKNSVGFGTGLLQNKWYINGMLSQINSDGFVDRASSDLDSYYLSAGYVGEKTSVNLLAFGGHEVTYQSWYGTPEAWAKGDEAGKAAYLDRNGWSFSEQQLANLNNSGRTYNFYEYENQVDDYRQDHYQLHLNHHFNSNWSANLSGHYTYGRGFFEEFNAGEDVADYGIAPFQFASDLIFADFQNGDGTFVNQDFENFNDWEYASVSQTPVLDADGNPTLNADGFPLLQATAQVDQSDIVRRRWLSNDFYGATWSFNYKKGKLNALVGGASNFYDGLHYGEIEYATALPNSFLNDRYYQSTGKKLDNSAYAKVYYEVAKGLVLFGDAQIRNIAFEGKGVDNDLAPIDFDRNFNFFNPKGGATYQISKADKVFVSAAKANREPRRSDIVDAPDGVELVPEELLDFELGYERRMERYFARINLYNMQYTNQLVPTGALNDVGAPIRTNAGRSFRRGVEVELGYRPSKKFEIYGNVTLSENKIENFVEVVEDYTNGFDLELNEFSNSDIAFSPNAVAAGRLSYFPLRDERKTVELSWQTKFVGDQFLDNTSDQARKIDSYVVSDLRLSVSIKPKWISEIQLNAIMYNTLDAQYSANGYSYNYILGDKIVENFLYPQAGRNFLVGITVRI